MKIKLLFSYIILIILLTILPLHLVFDFGDDQWSSGFFSFIPTDKMGHFSLYFGLGIIFVWNELVSLRNFFLGFLFAFIMEALHLAIPYRTFELMDLFSNELGFTISFLGARLQTRVQSHR